MKKIIYILGMGLLSSFSCNQPKAVADVETARTIKAQAALIAESTQKELMKNVSEAIQEGGTLYAVEFCNTAAIPLTDSVARRNRVVVQRISEKNRNPVNKLSTKTDKAVYRDFLQNKEVNDSLVENAKSYTYYKRMDIIMSTCLACHGNVETEIERQTFEKIKKLYPLDKATGYALDDFRGMWKISIDK